MAKQRGRPSINDDEGKTERKELRLSKKELEAFTLAAKVTGQSASDWMRVRLREAAKRELKKANKPVPFDS